MQAKMLSNEVLRERSIRGFLQASGIDSSQININCVF
ncbi:Uncharacterised protein [Legionella waltersii]|nr:Uncharacterised protein [Legionella waltersii]